MLVFYQQNEKNMHTEETDSNTTQARNSSSVVKDFHVSSRTSKTAFSSDSLQLKIGYTKSYSCRNILYHFEVNESSAAVDSDPTSTV